MSEEKAKMSVGKKIIICIIICFILFSVTAYIIGINYFSSHFLPGSMVNGFNCSYMTQEETENLLTAKTNAYVLEIVTRGNGIEGISAEEVGLQYTSDGSVKNLIMEQNRFRWFLSFNQKQSYKLDTSVSYDREKLIQAVKGLKCMQEENTIPPADAYIKENDEGFEIVPEEMGTTLKPKTVLQVLAKAMLSMRRSVNLEKEGCYLEPKVFSNDKTLVKNCERINKFTDIVITYDFADRTETVDRSVIKNWLIKDEDDNYILDKQKIAEFVNDLGYKYDTFGCTRTFHTYDGREKILQGGDYGWAIDQTAETEALIKIIKSGETQVREPVYAYEGWSRATNDIGYTYVEIDLTSQRLIFYKDGIPIADTPVVTGNPNIAGMETPTGCYAVDAMKSPAVLTGEGYAQDVNFWMPFAGNVGMHDAPWRADFGGSLYIFEGSHGCVNIPYDQAKIIYENIDIGAPVVVYK